MSCSSWVGATVCCPGRALPLNTSQPLLHTVGSAQKPLELPWPSLFLLSAQWPQTIHSRCQRWGLDQHRPHTKSICHPLCNALTTIS